MTINASPSSDWRRHISRIVLTLTTLLAAVLAWAYGQTDGGAWLGQKVTSLSAHWPLLTVLVAASALAGSAGALLSCQLRRTTLCGGLTILATTAALLAASDLPDLLGPALTAPDWLRTVLLIIAGASWGAGWAAARTWAGLRPPLIGFALPFLLAAMIVPLLSGTVSGALTAVWLMLFVPALGRTVWKLLPAGHSGRSLPPPRVIAYALGLAVLSALGLILGHCQIAYPVVLTSVLAILTLALRQPVRAEILATTRFLAAPAALSGAGALLAGMLGSVLLAQWIACLAPELGPDSIGARVATAAIWLREGGITAQPEIIISYMSIGGEALLLLLLPVAGYSVAKIVAFASLLTVTGALIGQGDKWRNSWAMAAAVVFCSSTIVWWQLIHGFVDLLQVSLLLGSAEALRRWIQKMEPRYAVVAGVLAGAATAIKLNGVLLMVGSVGVVLAVSFWRKRRVLSALGTALIVALPALLMLAPALVRSACLTGNPLFPFANTLFKSPLAPLALTTNHYGFPLGANTLATLYQIFLIPRSYGELGTYHPLLLPLAVGCAAALGAALRAARFWALATLVSAAFWLVSEQYLRYSLFVGLFAVFAIARTTASLRRPGVLERPLPALGLAFLVLAGLVLQIARPASWMWAPCDNAGLPLRWATGQENSEAFLRRLLPSYPSAVAANETAGKGARVWQIPPNLRDHLYFEGKVVSMPHGDLRMLAPLQAVLDSLPYPPGSRPGRTGRLTPEEIAATMRGEGLTHLLFLEDNPWTSGLPESAWPGPFNPALSRTWFTPVAAYWGARLYRVSEHPLPVERSRVPVGRLPLSCSHRDFAARSGQMFEIYLARVPEEAVDTDFVDFSWHDDSGKTLFLQRNAYPRKPGGTWHSWLASAPPGASRFRVYTNAVHAGAELEVFAVLPDAAMP